MKLDLKEDTKYREKETFNHLVTVLMIMFGDYHYLNHQQQIYKDAKSYLASYINGLLEIK